MNLENMILHMKDCLPIQKFTLCPLNCGESINTIYQSSEHFETCKNGLVKCDNCPATYVRFR